MDFAIVAAGEKLVALVAWLAPHTDDLALAAVIAAASYLSIVVGELVFKSFALRNAEFYALLVGQTPGGSLRLARPLVWLPKGGATAAAQKRNVSGGDVGRHLQSRAMQQKRQRSPTAEDPSEHRLEGAL